MNQRDDDVLQAADAYAASVAAAHAIPVDRPFTEHQAAIERTREALANLLECAKARRRDLTTAASRQTVMELGDPPTRYRRVHR